jgi:beta-glucosidase
MQFPDGFLWGTATAAHQVEGGNVNSDCWLLEHVKSTFFVEPSGDACDQYHRYAEDFALLQRLGFNSYRFGIEWARVEPEEGEFSRAEIEHYRRMLAACRERGLLPMVTLHHFTSPRWIAARGGFESSDTAGRFARYCERIAKDLGDLIGAACTLNELNAVSLLQQMGTLPSDEKILTSRWRAEASHAMGVAPESFSAFPFCAQSTIRDNILRTHREGYDALHSGRGKFPVGMTLALQELVPAEGGEDRCAAALRESEDVFIEAARGDDFAGVQTYTRRFFGSKGPLPPPKDAECTQMGYEFYPEALEATIRRTAAIAKCPIYVTESGIAALDDSRRVEFIRRALACVERCIRDGIDVRGYYYWSMLDNFEWILGYGPKFGLVAVDRTTQERIVKPSAEYLGRMARANSTSDPVTRA